MTTFDDAADASMFEELTTPRPIAEYHEDMGPVLWWCWEIPECGRCDGSGTVYDNVRCQTFACPDCNGKKPDKDEGRWKGEPPYVGSPNDVGFTVEAHTRIITQSNQEQAPTIARINAGGWPGYHTHWSPLPKVKEPK